MMRGEVRSTPRSVRTPYQSIRTRCSVHILGATGYRGAVKVLRIRGTFLPTPLAGTGQEVLVGLAPVPAAKRRVP